MLDLPPIYHEEGVAYIAKGKSYVLAQHFSPFSEPSSTTQEELVWDSL
jgi:hypothetical protein